LKSLKHKLPVGFLSLFLLLFISTACSVQRHLDEEESLLMEANIQNAPPNQQRALKNHVSQQPNTRFIGILPFRLWIYSGLVREEPRRFRSWLLDTFGEEPVVFDKQKMLASAESMERYLFNKGFFYAKVKPETEIRGHATIIHYHIEPGPEYKINNVRHLIFDKRIEDVLLEEKENTLIREGDRYDSDRLSSERVRIESLFREKGYFGFRRDFVYYDVDTTAGNHSVNINIGISNRPDGSPHRPYTIRSVKVYPDFIADSDPELYDTITYNNLTFISRNFPIRPKNLYGFISLEPGNLFRQSDVRKTIRDINALGTFQFVDVSFKEHANEHELTAIIKLSPGPKQQISVDTEVLTRERTEEGIELFSPERYYGLGTSFIYRHRNLARRGLQMEGNVGGLYELQFRDLNTNYQLRGGGSLIFPGGFSPLGIYERFARDQYRSSFNISYIFENNPNFIRRSGNFYLQYESSSNNLTRYFTPLQLSLVDTRAQDDFAEWLSNIEDPYLRDFYTNLYGSRHLIHGIRYSLIYNNRVIDRPGNYWFVRYIPIETAGNLFNFTNWLLGEETTHAPYTEINFYQYVKSEIDLRYYQQLDPLRKMVYRLHTGAGIPYGNSEFLPFEKRYFAGGTSSIRAWRVRTLGPGSAVSEDAHIDRTGDIKLEMNTEYRFPIAGRFEGALFVDAGNVWNLESREIIGSVFDWGNFYNQIAIGAGTGVRLDFGFFVFRLDLALKVRDPALTDQNQWVIQNVLGDEYWESSEDRFIENNYNFNFGIGYPF
jgi:outer membrane protein assembly factor BamA